MDRGRAEWSAAELDALLGEVEQAARRAGELLREGQRDVGAVRTKGEATDLLTRWDERAQALLRERLLPLVPGARWVAEEGAEGRGGQAEGLAWYVDPLGGTTNFVHGHPVFAVSVALYDGTEGLLGLVHAPALGRSWRARRGGGCWREDGRRCRVSSRTSLAEAVVATGFPYDKWHSERDNLAEFSAFLKRCRGVRRCGAASVDLAWVAEGVFDFYWERKLSAWDLAAGALLVLEAGGRLADPGGGSPDPLCGQLVASNGKVHAEGLALLASAGSRTRS